MKVFVTGGDGMLGSNLVRELLSIDYKVTVMTQPGRETGTLDGLNISKVDGDLLNPESLADITKNHDTVIHVAASTSIWPLRNEIVNKVNIDGTKYLLDAAVQNGVKKFIHVGTANTFGFGTKENPGREGNPYKADKYGMDYMDSKYKAHQLVLSYCDKIDATIVNPTFMMGAYDSAPSSGAMIVAIHDGKVPVCSPGGRNYICVKDVAVAIANAITMGRKGESYVLGNENLSYKEAFGKMGKVTGKKAPSKVLPKWMILLYGRLGSFGARITGKAPTVSYPMAQISCDEHYFTAQKAIDELKLPQTPIEEGMTECFEWLKEHNYIKA